MVFSGALCRVAAQVNQRLQPHLRVAQIGDESSDFAHAAILARMPIFSDFAHGKAHGRAQFFKVLANFVHGDASLLCRVPAQFEC